MIEIQVNNLVKSFEVGHNVLDGVTFQIDQGQRVGLLGKNGAGKSTLFKILIGELDCDEGTVTISPGHRMGLISQIPVYPEGYTVDDVLRSAFGRLHALTAEMEELAGRMAAGETDPAILKRYGSLSERFEVFGGYDTDVAISKVANGLSISDDMRGRLFDQLSGGEKTRVNLGRLILEDTDILLLDEPTNHLDLHATEWLEAYIQKFRGTVVAISHDRYFLDRSVNRVIEIENGKAEFYSGNYSFYAVEKERRYQERMKQYEKEQAKIAQLEKSAEQLRMWAFQGMDKTYRRAISMERRIERMRTTAKPTKARKMDARFTAAEFHGDEVLGIRNLSKAYGEKPLFEGISLKVEGGERIALIGDNGTGKSTLIKMIADEVYPDSGRIRLGPQVKLAYLPQIIHFDHPDWNLVENMMAAKRGISAQSARNRLAAYDFRGEDVLKPVSVSHDRYFINRFATRIWEVANGTITDYPMGFAQYRQVKAQEESEKAETTKPVKEKTVTEKPVRGDRAQQAARRQLTICEREIAKAEERIGALDAEMEANACDYEKLNALVADKDAAQAELDALYLRWEELSEAAGEA